MHRAPSTRTSCMRALASAALVLAPVAGAGAQQPAGAKSAADAAFDRAVAAFGQAKTLRATFDQTIVNSLTGTTVSAKGELLQRQPNLVSVRFADPAGDRIVADGKFLWVYLPSSAPGQVMKLKMGNDGAGNVDPVSQLLESPRARFTVVDAGGGTIAGRAVKVLSLTPKRGGDVTRAKVWVDAQDASIRQIELGEASGATRTLRFTSWEPNATLSKASFTFTPPKGVRVIDQAAMFGGR